MPQMLNQNPSDRLLQLNFEIISIFLETKEWYEGLEMVFRLVGNEVDVDRIYYWDIHVDQLTGEQLTSQRFEWVKDGIEPMIDNPVLQNLPIDVAADFMTPLLQHKPFESIIRELPEGQTKEILQSQDILSILVLPIYIENNLYGFIGFDDCSKERIWNKTELDFLKSITSNLSTAIQRHLAMEQLKVTTEELRVMNSDLEQFAYIASHDLQEPLRMVTGFLSLFEKKYSSLVDEQGKLYINYAVDGTVRMKKIIKDLLDYSRIGKTKDTIEEFQFKELVQEVVSLYENKIKQNNTRIIIGSDSRLITWKSPLTQILINLLDNSIKYSRKGVDPIIKIDIKEQPHVWLIQFEDNGIGIDEKYFKKIFIIFQRLHTREEYEGTGVGLAITKRLVESLGGKISLSSKPGEGSIFSVIVPKIK
jgi:signal transduction histidine kinase